MLTTLFIAQLATCPYGVYLLPDTQENRKASMAATGRIELCQMPHEKKVQINVGKVKLAGATLHIPSGQ